jgi:hypothetical protein
MKRMQLRAATILVSLAAVASTVLAVQPAQAAALDSTAKTVTFYSDHSLDSSKAVQVSALPASAQAQVTGVKPNDATPRGYVLRGGRPNGNNPDYRYDSDYIWAVEASCGFLECDVVQEVRIRLTENVVGTTSKRWNLVLQASPWQGSSAYSLSYYYECGVNIPDAIDQTCSTWRDDNADGPDSGPAYDGDTLNYSFGDTNNVTKFPMVNMMVEFADGSVALGDDGEPGEKFRGWDVCVTLSDTKLCSSTGTGN